jgi:hypothetical protein
MGQEMCECRSPQGGREQTEFAARHTFNLTESDRDLTEIKLTEFNLPKSHRIECDLLRSQRSAARIVGGAGYAVVFPSLAT